MKTAEEFIRDKVKQHYADEYSGQSLNYISVTAEQALRWSHEYASQFHPSEREVIEDYQKCLNGNNKITEEQLNFINRYLYEKHYYG